MPQLYFKDLFSFVIPSMFSESFIGNLSLIVYLRINEIEYFE